MNLLITAGPTREYIDPIRFISNASSGRQGIALARAAKRRGHRVVLVLGPGTVKPPDHISVINVVSAKDMLGVVLRYKKWMDALIMAAAVGDWKPVRKSRGKIKKTSKTKKINLSQNPDIIARVARLREQKKTRPGLKLVGFSVDTSNLIGKAIKKLQAKGADFIIANPIDAFGSASTRPVILHKSGIMVKVPSLSKNRLALKIIKLIEK